jgi:hypothetical protein
MAYLENNTVKLRSLEPEDLPYFTDGKIIRNVAVG